MTFINIIILGSDSSIELLDDMCTEPQYNRRAIRCYGKCGFIKEGLDLKGALIEGKYETDIYMGILENEYNNFTK